LGSPSKAQNISVILPSALRWDIVSTPLPVRSNHATRLGPRTLNVSSPRGETLTCASGAAVATKNIG
jgi:hypothetical protein